jgi:hypothetical protein
VGKPCTSFERLEVDIRVKALILAWATRADLQEKCVLRSSILQMMAIGSTGFESGTVAGNENLFARVGDQGEFAFHDINELIFVRMPMPLA